MGNRSTIDIASDVLEAANGGASKIEIMYKAFLSYNQMKVYVNFLNEKGLLVYDNQHGEAHTFRTTEKGLRFLDIYNRLDDMIKEDNEEEAIGLSEGEQISPEEQQQAAEEEAAIGEQQQQTTPSIPPNPLFE